jgi:hypothetical protein
MGRATGNGRNVPDMFATVGASATGCTPQPDDPEADARAKAFFARMISSLRIALCPPYFFRSARFIACCARPVRAGALLKRHQSELRRPARPGNVRLSTGVGGIIGEQKGRPSESGRPMSADFDNALSVTPRLRRWRGLEVGDCPGQFGGWDGGYRASAKQRVPPLDARKGIGRRKVKVGDEQFAIRRFHRNDRALGGV